MRLECKRKGKKWRWEDWLVKWWVVLSCVHGKGCLLVNGKWCFRVSAVHPGGNTVNTPADHEGRPQPTHPTDRPWDEQEKEWKEQKYQGGKNSEHTQTHKLLSVKITWHSRATEAKRTLGIYVEWGKRGTQAAHSTIYESIRGPEQCVTSVWVWVWV